MDILNATYQLAENRIVLLSDYAFPLADVGFESFPSTVFSLNHQINGNVRLFLLYKLIESINRKISIFIFTDVTLNFLFLFFSF